MSASSEKLMNLVKSEPGFVVVRMTNVIQSEQVAEKAISVRLDADAQRSLELLMRDGTSQSERDPFGSDLRVACGAERPGRG